MSEGGDGRSGGGGEPRTEVEATLVVASDRPARVERRVVRLAEAGGRPLRWIGTRELRDVYFDLGSGALRERGLALRLREEGGGWTLTLKGDARPGRGGEVERMEMEAAWSRSAFRSVLSELGRRGVEVPAGPASPAGSEPVEAVRSAGFGVLQERAARRRIARVLSAGDGEPVAELALDTVLFRDRSGRRVRHREVEIEATGAAPPGLPGRIASALEERFGGELRPWAHGKLPTGRALRDLDPPATSGGDLVAEAYDLLEERLAQHGESR